MSIDKPRRKRRWLFRLFILLAIPLFLLFLMGKVLGFLMSEEVTVEPGTVLEIGLSGSFSEGPGEAIWSELTGERKTSLWQLRRALEFAAEDEDIVGIRVLVQPAFFGWGLAEEVLEEFDRFRESGKPVYVLLQSDMVGDLEYFLSTCGDRVWISPETGVLVNGLALEVTFWRGTLDKLKIEPEVIMFKEYKSAGEPFLNKEMSPYMREAYLALLEDFDKRFEDRVCGRRGISVQSLRDFLDKGIAASKDLHELEWVDEEGYLDEVEKAFEESLDLEEYKGVALRDYLRALDEDVPDATETIAVVFGEGPIVSQAAMQGPFGMGEWLVGPKVASYIREAADDENVKAILFRVNSPGGSAVGSDVVLREIDRAREKGKKVIVSMSSVAGSGGYWVAMHADGIVAQPTTITGSIGVVFTKLNLTGFMDWIGANVETLTTAPMADIMGTTPLDPDRRERVEAWMEDLYDSFKTKVALGRDLPAEKVEEIARGRVWTGQDALDLGLVDRLGGIEEALALAKETAGLDASEEYRVKIYPKPKPFLQQLLEGDFFTQTPKVPSETEVLKWAREAATLRVLVQMPEIRVY